MFEKVRRTPGQSFLPYTMDQNVIFEVVMKFPALPDKRGLNVSWLVCIKQMTISIPPLHRYRSG